MADAAETARRAWLEQVLGMRWPQPQPEPQPQPQPQPRPRPRLLPVWRQAKEAVDGQLQRLEQALRDSGLKLGRAIADRGLVGALGPAYIRLTALLLDCDRASGADWDAAARRAAVGVQSLRAQLASSPALATLERNPLGVTVMARGMLGEALDHIAAVLDRR